MWKPLIIEIKTLLDSNPHLGGDLNVYQSQTNLHNILLDLPDGVSTHAQTGTAIKGIAGENLNESDLCYLHNNKWYRSATNNIATLPSTGVATENALIDEEIYFLLEGIVKHSGTVFTNIPLHGTAVYLLGEEGEVTNVQSDGHNSFSNNVQIVGTALTENTWLFSPDYTILEHV